MMRRDLLLFQADHRVFEFFFFKVFQYSFEAFRDVLTTLDNDSLSPGDFRIDLFFCIVMTVDVRRDHTERVNDAMEGRVDF